MSGRGGFTLSRAVEQILGLQFCEDWHPRQSALLILPGVQDYRIPQGAKYWPKKARHLWVAGTRGNPFYARAEVIQIVLGVLEKVALPMAEEYLETGGWANNTVDQMRWATELLKKNPLVKHLIICTAEYHVPRCTLTFLRTLLLYGDYSTVISVLPLRNEEGPFSGSKEWKEELTKISLYQKKGDVASFRELTEYLAWRSHQ